MPAACDGDGGIHSKALEERLAMLRSLLMSSHDRAIDLVEECAKVCCGSLNTNIETVAKIEIHPSINGHKETWAKEKKQGIVAQEIQDGEGDDMVREITSLHEEDVHVVNGKVGGGFAPPSHDPPTIPFDDPPPIPDDDLSEVDGMDDSLHSLHVPDASPDQDWECQSFIKIKERDISGNEADDQFEVLDCWSTVKHRRKSGGQNQERTSSHRKSMRDTGRGSGRQSAYDGVDYDIKLFGQDANGFNKAQTLRFILHPNNALRATWDTLSIMLLLYDLIMVPFLLFEPPENAVMTGGAWVCRVFWTIDVVFSFITGYYLTSDGTFEMRFSFIVKRYLKTWFCLDMVIVTLDWLELWFRQTNGFGVMRGIRASRFVRILRMLRLLRVLRLQDAIKGLLEQVKSERLSLLADIFKITIFLVFVSHSIACCWYWIGTLNSGEDNWIAHAEFQGKSLDYKYTTAMHWALSQFQGGMDEVRPWNFPERIFAVFIYLCSYLCAIIFVSRITSSTTQLFILTQRESARIQLLREYLTQNSVPRRLATRIARNAQDASKRAKQRIDSKSVELLQLVSEPLHEELNFELFGPVFNQHRFFFRYTDECPQVMCKVCRMAVSTLEVCEGDVMFHGGEKPLLPRLLVIGKGVLQYLGRNGLVTGVHEGEFIAEAVLWTSWIHQGTLTADRHCLLHVVSADNFQKVVSNFLYDKIADDANPLKYARRYVDALNQCDEEELTDCFCIESEEGADNLGEDITGKNLTVLSGTRFIDWLFSVDDGGRRGQSAANQFFGSRNKPKTKDAFPVTPQSRSLETHDS